MSLIQRSWFLFPPSSTAVSFQFANRKDRGIVLNEKMVTVGEVVGDGSKYVFFFFFWFLFSFFPLESFSGTLTELKCSLYVSSLLKILIRFFFFF